MKIQNSRIYALDALKFLSAILIVFHHYQQITGVVFKGVNFYGGRINFGYIVELFFILSGFWMALRIDKYTNEKFMDFIKSRCIRIYPMAMMSTSIYIIAAWIYRGLSGAWWADVPVGMWKAFTSLFLIQSGGAIDVGLGANNPTWYLSVLLICYIIYYFVLWLAKIMKVTPIYFFVMIMLLGLGINFYGIELPFLNWTAARGYIAFFWGVILCCILTKSCSIARLKGSSIIILVAVFILTIWNPNEMWDNFSMILTFLIYPAVIVLLLTSNMLKTILEHKIFGTLGGISFEMYLWHVPIMLIIANIHYLLGYKPEYSWISMGIFTVITFVTAAILFVFVEKPLTLYLNRCLEKAGE